MANAEVASVAESISFTATGEAQVASVGTSISFSSVGGAEVPSVGIEIASSIPIGEAAVFAIAEELAISIPPGEMETASVALEIAVSFGTEPDVTMETITLDVEIHVVPVENYSPLTGSFSVDEIIPGWRYDRTRVEDSRVNQAQYLTTIGGHTVGLTDGTKQSYWQSGTNGSCKYLRTTYKHEHDYTTWTPVVEPGAYTLFHDKHTLLSDYSYVGRFSTTLEDGLMVKPLRPDTKWDTVEVALYTRDSSFKVFKYWSFNYVEQFTGEIDSGARLDTGTPDAIVVANLATRKKEFMIIDDRVVLNGDYEKSNEFTTSPVITEPPASDAGSLLESLGSSNPIGRSAYLKYFPVDHISIWFDDLSGDLVELTEVEQIAYADPTLACYEVDYDLGIVTTCGYQAPSLVLKADVTDSGTQILVFEDPTLLDQWPNEGVILLDTELIAYTEKTSIGFTSLVRAYSGSIASAHTAGASVVHQRQGASLVGKLYAEYVAVPRVSYEVTTNGQRACNKGKSWLDVKPICNVETTNVLQIYSGDIIVDHITLETDKPLIGGNLFGPLYYGSDVARLTATAYDPNDNPVQDIDVTIAITSGSGSLDGAGSSVTDITNTLGEAYAVYNHPLVQDQLERRVTDVTYVGGDTHMLVDGLVGNELLDDIWLLQVLKHDRVTGAVGAPAVVLEDGLADQPYGVQYLLLDGLFQPADIIHGLVDIEIGGTRYLRAIQWAEHVRSVDDVLQTKVYLQTSVPSTSGETAYVLEANAVQWDSTLLNGTRVIVYEYSTEAEHPLTGLPGAYIPIHPDSIVGNSLVFVGRHLPVPDPVDNSVNLGAYKVIAPGLVSLQATASDEFTNRLIFSNEVRLRLQLPNYLTGVDTSGALPVPVGFKLTTESFNTGGGLGGSNFLTVNPRASLVNQFALRIEVP